MIKPADIIKMLQAHESKSTSGLPRFMQQLFAKRGSDSAFFALQNAPSIQNLKEGFLTAEDAKSMHGHSSTESVKASLDKSSICYEHDVARTIQHVAKEHCATDQDTGNLCEKVTKFADRFATMKKDDEQAYYQAVENQGDWTTPVSLGDKCPTKKLKN